MSLAVATDAAAAPSYDHFVTRRAHPVDVRVEALSKSFGGAHPALANINLDVAGGELVALLGPSGSGKTTLLRIIAGLDFPTAGRILFSGADALARGVQERNIGFVFQHYALFRHMTVFDNIAFGLTVRPRETRPPAAEIRARVLALLDLVQLGGLEKRYPAQLSGGQRQRVALARALAIEPQILLLDEPFGALDAKVRKDLRRWLREIHDRTGHTTLFVTHDQDEAMELADRVVVMSKGHIEQVGTPDAIYDHPETPFVFDFIGQSIQLPVEVRAGRVTSAGQPLAVAAGGLRDGPATLFARPQDVQLAAGDEGLAGEVLALRRSGASRLAEVAVGPAGTRVELVLAADRPVSVGDRVRLGFARARLFPAG